MFTDTQIEVAAETLRTPFAYSELEAMRKLALWLYLHRRPLNAPAPVRPRKKRRCSVELLEKIEDVITSNEPPCVLMQRHDYSMLTIRAIKAGYAAYKRSGGCPEFWRSYHRQYREEISSLIRQHG